MLTEHQIVRDARSSRGILRDFLERHPAFRSLLRTVGVVAIGRELYTRRELLRGRKDIRFLDNPVSFSVTTRQEVHRLDHVILEEPLLRQLAARLRDGDLLTDVGANIGVVALLMAKSVPGLEVHAFEPLPSNLAALRRNVGLNALTERVFVHDCAIGLGDGTAQLHANPNAGEGQGSLDHRAAVPGAPTHAVRVRSLDDFCTELRKCPSAIKIDVEGWEWEVLRGMQGILSSRRLRVIAIEEHPELLRKRGLDPMALIEPLTCAGFKETWSSSRGGERQAIFERGN